MKVLTTTKLAKGFLASLLVVLLVLISLSAASPGVHKLLHSDAADAGHHCIITEFTKGHVDFAASPVFVFGLALLFGGIALLRENIFVPQSVLRFSRCRAPPRF
jgi:hypothetical protein